MQLVARIFRQGHLLLNTERSRYDCADRVRDTLETPRRHMTQKTAAPRTAIRCLLLIVFLLLVIPAAGSQEKQVDYALIVTGGEMLEGIYADAHTHFLTQTLRPLGLRCISSTIVADDEDDIKRALKFASAKVKLVIVTGGLGPTDNDLTRKVISDFTGIEVKEHPDALKEIAERFDTTPDDLVDRLRIQGRVPVKGTYLSNHNGTAVGPVFEKGDSVIVALPGPPHELQVMVRKEMIPYLSRKFGTRVPGCSLTVRFAGLGQSQIAQLLDDHVPLPDEVSLSSRFEGGRVDFTFALEGDTPKERTILEELKKKILRHLGEHIYAADASTTLEQTITKLIEEKKAKLTLVEAGSGGGLAAGLSGAEGALSGAYIAPTEEKLSRLLRVPDERWSAAKTSAERTRLLAEAAAALTENSWTVAVGESDGSQVEAVFRSPDGKLEAVSLKVRGTSARAKSWLATRLLDHLRRRLKK